MSVNYAHVNKYKIDVASELFGMKDHLPKDTLYALLEAGAKVIADLTGFNDRIVAGPKMNLGTNVTPEIAGDMTKNNGIVLS